MRPAIHELDLPGRMTPSDALFWYAESALPNLRPVIAVLHVLDRVPDLTRFNACLDTALRAVPRLRQRVVEGAFNLGLPQWVEDVHLDRDYHFRHISLPAPGSMRELLDVSAQIFASPLDRERPVWDATLIDGLEGERAALLLRTHHCVVDGVGSIAILAALTQTERDAPLPRVVRRRLQHRAAPAMTLADRAILSIDNVFATGRMIANALALPWQAISQPGKAVSEIQRTLRGLRGVVADAAHPLIRDPLVTTTSGLSRRFDVMDVPLARIHAIRDPLGVTLNDIVLAALAGCIHAYHRGRRVHVDVLNCMVPMSLRAENDRSGLGNRVGMFSIRLPVGEREPETRLRLICEQTHAAKSDKRGTVYPALLALLPFVPGAAFRLLARQALGRVNLVCTNVPGLPEQRYLAGATVEAVYPLVAIVEGTPLVVAMLSYAGCMNIGIDTDPEAIPDPHRLGTLMAQAFDELEVLARRRG